MISSFNSLLCSTVIVITFFPLVFFMMCVRLILFHYNTCWNNGCLEVMFFTILRSPTSFHYCLPFGLDGLLLFSWSLQFIRTSIFSVKSARILKRLSINWYCSCLSCLCSFIGWIPLYCNFCLLYLPHHPA